jgi:hypothetical protein
MVDPKQNGWIGPTMGLVAALNKTYFRVMIAVAVAFNAGAAYGGVATHIEDRTIRMFVTVGLTVLIALIALYAVKRPMTKWGDIEDDGA